MYLFAVGIGFCDDIAVVLLCVGLNLSWYREEITGLEELWNRKDCNHLGDQSASCTSCLNCYVYLYTYVCYGLRKQQTLVL